MKVRLYSDFHLDSCKGDPWEPPALVDDLETTLVLAGDLWTGPKWISHEGDSWISKVAARFRTVLVVLGNHDYWDVAQRLTIQDGAQKCRDLLADHGVYNVHALDCSTFEDKGILFAGATLWTDINHGDPLLKLKLPEYMRKDTKAHLKVGHPRFTANDWVETHKRHRKFFEEVLASNTDKKVVCISHHVPLLNLGDPLYAGQFSNAYYMSDLSDLALDNDHLVGWFYGHTHYRGEFQLNNCLYVNNCVGYEFEQGEKLGLVQHKILEV